MYLKKLWPNFLNLKKEIDIQVQEAQRVPNRPAPTHIIIKISKFNNKRRF